MLRTIPNNTHGSLMRRFAWDVPLMLSVNENCLQQEKVRRIVLDGTMTVESDWTAVKGSLSLTRVLFPSVDEAAFCEKYILKNTGEKPLYVEIPRARSVIRTAPAKGVEGSYELVAEICGDTALMLAPRAEVAFGAFFSGRRSGDEALALNADAECAKRRALVAEWQRNLVLDTPDPVIDAMVRLCENPRCGEHLRHQGRPDARSRRRAFLCRDLGQRPGRVHQPVLPLPGLRPGQPLGALLVRLFRSLHESRLPADSQFDHSRRNRHLERRGRPRRCSP